MYALVTLFLCNYNQLGLKLSRLKKRMQKHNNMFIKMVNMTNTRLNNYCMNKEMCIIMHRYLVKIYLIFSDVSFPCNYKITY